MGGHGCAVGGRTAAGFADALGDVEDDGCKTIFVEVDFLVVGHLTDCAGFVSLLSSTAAKDVCMYLPDVCEC